MLEVEVSQKPIVASFTNQTDKWEVLCLARVNKNGQVVITEDIPGKKVTPRLDKSGHDTERTNYISDTETNLNHSIVETTCD